MTLRDRLLNIARAELRGAARRVRGAAEDLFGDEDDERRDVGHDYSAPSPPPIDPGPSAEVLRYYANLELEVGAGPKEVKAAYRRLLRRYHPDLHQSDPAQAEVATRLTAQLRTAYDGLNAHLGVKTL